MLFGYMARYAHSMQKNSVLRLSSRKYFPSFDVKLTPRAAVVFVAECLAIFLFASAGRFGFAFALGLFCGLVYARQNVLALAPAFMVACCVFSQQWWTLLYSATPVLVLVVLYAIYFRLKRNVPIFAVALAALLSMTPYIVCNCIFYADYLTVAVNAVLAIICTFCASIVCYALLVRRAVSKLTFEERICAGAVLVVASYALSKANIYGLSFYGIVFGFAVLFCADCLKASTTLFVSLLFGAGSAIAGGTLSPLAAAAVCGAAAVALAPFTKWSCAMAILCLEAIFWLLNSYTGSGWQALAMTAIGVLCYLCVPKSAGERIRRLARRDGRSAYTGIVNRHNSELAGKLGSVSDVFFEMSKNMENFSNSADEYSPIRLAKEVAKNYCGKCADREACFCALGDDTSSVIEPMAAAAINRGKVTILDMPPFITGRCGKMHSLAAVINSSAEAYAKRKEQADGVEVSKKLMSEQFAGVALVLDSLATECGRRVSFASDSTEMLVSELLKHNIVASEAVISGTGSDTSVAVTVRPCDAEKAVLARIASSCLRTKLELAKLSERGENIIVHLESAPIYEVAYGIADKVRGENGVSGDSKSVLCPSRRRRLFAICDGMGSGERAAQASRDAVNMIENFYRAGIDNGIILSLVNKLLRLSMDDCFSSLDIAVVDTVSGGLDVIKLGAAGSFIVRKDNIEMLSSVAPPAGILDSIVPVTSRYQLYDGDMIVMMSDGVFDALDPKGVTDIIDALDTSNPQTLADALLTGALERGAEDDCTVMVLRVFCM